MKILDCSCGHSPTLESNPGGFNSWDVFCFKCGKHTTCHPSKQNAIRAWNGMMTEEPKQALFAKVS